MNLQHSNICIPPTVLNGGLLRIPDSDITVNSVSCKLSCHEIILIAGHVINAGRQIEIKHQFDVCLYTVNDQSNQIDTTAKDN